MLSLILTLVAAAPWHQGVSYEIDVKLNDSLHILTGHETVLYINRSPYTLNEIWFHLYANAFREGSIYFREQETLYGRYSSRYAKQDELGYIEVSNIKIDGISVDPEIEDTEMRLKLPHSLSPGDSIRIMLDFRLKIPKNWQRLGHRGHHYDLTQWYPKVVVFDELGWHPDGYHYVGEFYGEFARYEVKLTLPKRYVIGSTGTIVGPQEYIARLDSIANGLQVDTSANELVTVEMVADSVHDFAIIADPKFKIIRTHYGKTTVHILYPQQHEKLFSKVTNFIPRILETYKRWYGPYPYDKLTITWGTHGPAMEYPKLVIIPVHAVKLPIRSLTELFFEAVIAHEVAHQWFYGIIANNEMDEPWLDESFASFTEVRYMEAYYPSDSIRNRLRFLRFMFPKGIKHGDFARATVYSLVGSSLEDPIIGPKAYKHRSYWVSVYHKGAMVLRMLQYLLGDTLFDSVMHEYYRRYQFKHVRTQDFINTVEDVTGKDMGWFFELWLFGTTYPDFVVKSVKNIGDTTVVEVTNLGQPHMPVDVALGSDTVRLERNEKVVKFVGVRGNPIIDPKGIIPESGEWNNTRRVKFSLLIPSFTDPSVFSIALTPLLGLKSVGLTAFGVRDFREHINGLVFYNWSDHTLTWDSRYDVELDKRVSSFGLSASGYGMKVIDTRITLNYSKRKLFFSPRVWWLKGTLHFGRCTDSTGLAPYYEPASYFGVELQFVRYFHNPILTGSFETKVGTFYTFNDRLSESFGGELTLAFRWPIRFAVSTKFMGVHGDAPVQLRPFLEGKPLMPFGTTFKPAGLVGYTGQGLSGNIFVMMELNKSFFRMLKLYTAAGWINNGPLSDIKVRWEAGLKLSFRTHGESPFTLSIPFEVILPIWISHPKEGQKAFGFRVAIAITD